MGDVVASGEFEIVGKAKNAGTKPSDHGTLVKWYCGFKSTESAQEFEDVYWQRKQGSETNIGDKVSGRIEKGQYGLRFFTESEKGFRGGGGGGQMSPERQRAITRQHSQEMALRLIAASGDAKELNLSDPEIVSPYLNSTVRKLADWFDADVEGVAKAGESE